MYYIERTVICMAKIDVYKNSKFATFLSALGWIALACGSYFCFDEKIGWEIGVILLVIAFVLKVLAFLLDKFVGRMKSKRAAKKNQMKSEDVSSASDDSQEKAKARATLDEFAKYKELLSKGTITREEFDAKTGELFKDYVKKQ